jgi:hypothetical protein
MKDKQISRRKFLKQAAAVGGALPRDPSNDWNFKELLTLKKEALIPFMGCGL